MDRVPPSDDSQVGARAGNAAFAKRNNEIGVRLVGLSLVCVAKLASAPEI
jgi:hypothetical protein